MKVFLINLDVDKERLAVADAQLQRLGVEYERIPAVYGKALSEAERRVAVNRFRWWCAIGRPILSGEIGCALSHYHIYRRLIDESIPYACILEDDVVLEREFKDQLAFVESRLSPKDPDVILLSNHTKEYCTTQCLKEASSNFFAEGYVVTNAAAKALLEENLPLQVPVNHWSRWVRLRAIRLYHAFPTVCSQDWTSFVSNMKDESWVATKELSWVKFLARKMKRTVGKSMDNAGLYLRKWRREKR